MSSFSHFVRSLAIADGSGESVHHGRRQNRVLHTDGHEALTLPLTLQPCPGLARYFGTIGIGVLGKNFRNVPERAISAWTIMTPGNLNPETFYIRTDPGDVRGP